MKTIDSEKPVFLERLSMNSSVSVRDDLQIKILILKWVFFGSTLLGSMIVYLWAFLPHL